MSNKIYEAPELIITALNNQDVLTASAGDTELFDLW